MLAAPPTSVGSNGGAGDRQSIAHFHSGPPVVGAHAHQSCVGVRVRGVGVTSVHGVRHGAIADGDMFVSPGLVVHSNLPAPQPSASPSHMRLGYSRTRASCGPRKCTTRGAIQTFKPPCVAAKALSLGHGPRLSAAQPSRSSRRATRRTSRRRLTCIDLLAPVVNDLRRLPFICCGC